MLYLWIPTQSLCAKKGKPPIAPKKNNSEHINQPDPPEAAKEKPTAAVLSETAIEEADILETDIQETDIQELDIQETDIQETDIQETDIQQTDNQESDILETYN